MIKFTFYIIVYIDYNDVLRIAKQIIIIISFIIKLNLQFIPILKYIQRFRSLKFRYKLEK